MRKINILMSVGISVGIILTGIDKFVYNIPNVVYIPIAILGVLMILIGYFKDITKNQ